MSDALSDIAKEGRARKEWETACDLIAFRLYKNVRFYDDKKIRDLKVSDFCLWFNGDIKRRIDEMMEGRNHPVVKKAKGHKGYVSQKEWSRRNYLVRAKKADWVEPEYRTSSDDAWAAAGLDGLDEHQVTRE